MSTEPVAPKPRFVPKTIPNNQNVAPSSALGEFALLLIGIVVGIVLSIVLLSLAIDFVLQRSPGFEAKLCEWAQPYAERAFSEDEPGRAGLLKLTQDLSKDLSLACRPTVFVLDKMDVSNAVALPGGVMLVTRELLQSAKTENELSFVIAHELGHFALRHHVRGVGRGIVFVIASLFGAELPESVLNPVFSLVAAQYSQRDESEADRIALDIVAKHYGHVGGAFAVFERFADEEQIERTLDVVDGLFRSHPYSSDRIEKLKQMSAQKGYRSEPPTAFEWPASFESLGRP